MANKASKTRSAKLFQNLERLATFASCHSENTEDEPLELTTLMDQQIRPAQDSSKTLRMKKFRIQLLHHWLVSMFEPCRAADIGGGKGLLTYLLNKSGWDSTVIDPVVQSLPDKYKDIETGQRVKIPSQEKISRLQSPFEVANAEPYKLLIGMHAHGCNAKIIDASALYGCGFVLFPCCVIDEPFYPRLGVHWLESLADYALFKGQEIIPFRLNFKGQNIGLWNAGKADLRAPA